MTDRYLKPRARDRFMTMPVSGGYDVTPRYLVHVDFAAALLLRLQTGAETVNTTDFTAVNTPAFEEDTTSFPNDANQKFIDFSRADEDGYTFDSSSYDNKDLIYSVWLKPDEASTSSTYENPINAVYNTTATLGYYSGNALYRHGLEKTWKFLIYGGSESFTTNCTTFAYNADAVLHFVILCKNNAGLDNSKSVAIYVNNSLNASSTTTYTGTTGNPTSYLGDYAHVPGDYQARMYDGGMFDFAAFTYSTLAAKYTDAEIVQFLYDNSAIYGAHKFCYDL